MTNPCYHPLSCTKCSRNGSPCGSHSTQSQGHERCKGQESTLATVECPPCQGKGETPEPGTFGPTTSPEHLVTRPCALCQGTSKVTQELLDHHDAHIASIEF